MGWSRLVRVEVWEEKPRCCTVRGRDAGRLVEPQYFDTRVFWIALEAVVVLVKHREGLLVRLRHRLDGGVMQRNKLPMLFHDDCSGSDGGE